MKGSQRTPIADNVKPLPLPLQSRSVGYGKNGTHYELVGPQGRIICRVWSPDEADAIVARCNAHDDLLKALNGLFKECAMTHKHWGDDSNNREADEAIAFAKSVIAKAEA